MPLTNEEREFLDANVYEATHEPFGGPATSDLRRRAIFYSDLHGLLTSYHREACSKQVLPFGTHNPSPPPNPWANREQAMQRDGILLEECTQQAKEPSTLLVRDSTTADLPSNPSELPAPGKA